MDGQSRLKKIRKEEKIKEGNRISFFDNKHKRKKEKEKEEGKRDKQD